MASIVIAEKPSQAESYRKTIGSRYGEVLSARGHLFELTPPDKLKPDLWKVWTIGLLRDGDGFYPSEFRDADARKRYEQIRDKARSADTIYVATDPDREGEGIGGDIINKLRSDIGWKGRVLRVLRLAEDQKSTEDAFSNAEPAENFAALYQSYKARSNADHIFNLSLTRSASVALNPEGTRGVVSIGRVLTPTLGIVCRRELAISQHVPRDYFHPWVDVSGAAGKVRLTHNPGEKGRMFEPADAERIAASAAGYAGPISARTERKKQKPPVLFSLSKLKVEASRRMKWSTDKTESVLQALYETHKVATYPRSMEVSLPETEIPNAPVMMKGILALPFAGQIVGSASEPVIRIEKGAFSDKALKGAAHSAIVPNVNTVDQWPTIWGRLNDDERKLFELIARRYLAAISPDRVYDSTKLSVVVSQREFSVSGTVEILPGWRAALGTAPEKDSDQDQEEDGGALPPFRDGDTVKAINTGLQKLATKPPARFTDASLEIAMIEAWREVADPQLKAILKETDGIGTEATRKDVVVNLKDRGFIEIAKNGGQIKVIPAGMALYDILMRYAPRLLDVGLTGEMENMLNSIKSGEVRAADTVNKICDLALVAIDGLKAAKSRGMFITGLSSGGKKAGGKPTEAMVKAARSKAEREGKKLPPGVASDFAKCRAYLGELKPRDANAPPGQAGSGPRPATAAQLAFAAKLASERGAEIPEDVRQSSASMSAWIEKMKGAPRQAAATGGVSPVSSTAPGEPSPKAVAFAENIAARRGMELPAIVRGDKVALSKWIDSNKGR